MAGVLLAILGFICGAAAVYFLFEPRRKRVELLSGRLERLQVELDDKERETVQGVNRLLAERSAFESARAQFQATHAEFHRRVVAYDELVRENSIVKADLKNFATIARKQEYDKSVVEGRQKTIQKMVDELGRQYLSDVQKWISRGLTANNYSSSKKRMEDIVEKCKAIGVVLDAKNEAEFFAKLKTEYGLVVKLAVERENQARLKSQMREEEERRKEDQRAVEEAEQAEIEKQKIADALATALAEASGKHSEEILQLQQKLAEAEAKSERAKSLAELTRVGHVYVISNIGSFGEGVYKIGMTRRRDPEDRVVELGDASVPFPFDIHMMIATDDAPKLEKTLHHAFYRNQVNKVNPRKEFFQVSLDEIVRVVKAHRGEVEYVVDAEAIQYRESLKINPEEQRYIEAVFEQAHSQSE